MIRLPLQEPRRPSYERGASDRAGEGKTGAAGRRGLTGTRLDSPHVLSFFLFFSSTKCLFTIRTTTMTNAGHQHHHNTPSLTPTSEALEVLNFSLRFCL